MALTFFVDAAHASACRLQTSSPSQSIIGFPSGREVAVYGHAHGMTEEVLDLRRLAEDKLSSNEQYLENAKNKLKSLSATLTDYRIEVAHLHALAKASKLNFIGLEYGPKIMNSIDQFSKDFMPMARANFKMRGISNEALLDDTFLVLVGPAHYLTQTEPKLMKDVSLAGVEDEDLMQRSLNSQLEGRQKLYEYFLVVLNVGEREELRQIVKNAYHKAVREYDRHRFLEDDWIMAEIENKVPDFLLPKAKAVLNSALATAELLRQRDKLSFPKLMSLNGSGVLLIGFMHQRSISTMLELACLMEKPAPTATPETVR